MGQQQLLLIILVVMVVGIATIVATNVISSGADQANRDAVRQDLMTAAASVQHIYERPTMMGGAGKDFQTDYTDVLLAEDINLPGDLDGTTITNDNGVYTISSTDASTIVIEAVPSRGGDNMTITVERNTNDEWVYTLVDGDLTITNNPDSGGSGSGGSGTS